MCRQSQPKHKRKSILMDIDVNVKKMHFPKLKLAFAHRLTGD